MISVTDRDKGMAAVVRRTDDAKSCKKPTNTDRTAVIHEINLTKRGD